MFDATKYFNDYHVSFISEGHKHCQPGWIQLPCPFCIGNPGFHLGFNLSKGYFNCWRCGFHSNLEVIKTLSNTNWSNAKEISKVYESTGIFYKPKFKIKKKKFKLPLGTEEVKKRHIKYLEKRNYDSKEIINTWGLLGTGTVGPYKHRLIAPITFNGRIVSFQGRDITNKSKLKYKACPMAYEIINHKNILYGLDEAIGDTCILVEGITDVWRLGKGAIATFGIETKETQIDLIAERFNRVNILFDDDPQAIKQAYRIGHKLIHLGCSVTINLIEGDPGDLSNEEASDIVRKIFG